MLLVKCINAKEKNLKEGQHYIVTKNVLGLNMWYMLKGLENKAAYPCDWFEVVDRNYIQPVEKEIEEQIQLSLF